MADIKRLEDQWLYVTPDDLLRYMQSIVTHLEPALGPWLDVPDCAALADVLIEESFGFEDGFKTNGLDVELLNTTRAARIAACFCDNANDTWSELRKYRRTITVDELATHRTRMNAILDRILSSLGVVRLMDPFITRLLAALDEEAAILRRYQAFNWAELLEESAAMIRRGDSRGLDLILGALGGTGSLTDFVWTNHHPYTPSADDMQSEGRLRELFEIIVGLAGQLRRDELVASAFNAAPTKSDSPQ